MNDVAIVRTSLDGHADEVRPLVREYYAFADRLAVQHFGDRLDGIDVEDAADGDLERLASADVAEPLLLARTDEFTVGTVQLKRLDAETAEVKRLYVVPERRGDGIGRALLERVVDGAEADGFTTLRLGVGPFLDRARAMYEDAGFEETLPYEETGCPEVLHDDWHFMRLDLD